VNQIVEQMQTYYAKRAPVYDASMGYDRPETVEHLAPVIALMRDLVRGRTVLELACGPCFWTHQVDSAVKSIMATDYNESTLAEARRKPLDWDKVTLQVADAYHLPDFPVTFNACMAIDWFAHVPRSRFHEFLCNIQRILVKNSPVVFCDQLAGPHSLSNLYDEEGDHLQTRTLPDGSRYRVIKHFLTDDEFRSILSPYSNDIEIKRFEECRRSVVSYHVDGGQTAAADAV
jgi:ubiquinone/menaquinone biosynthesis C-methylase UbiE